MENQYKVGDKVKISNYGKLGLHQDEPNGCIGEITQYDGIYYHVILDTDVEFTWACTEEEMELVNET